MSVWTRIQSLSKIVAFGLTALFLPLSAGLALHSWLQTLGRTALFPPWIIAPFALVVGTMGLAPWSVCLALGLGIVAIVVAWRGIRKRWARALLAVGLLAMLAFPLVYRYQPAVMAAPGHRLILVTMPVTFCEHVQRNAETYWEIKGCDYELVGWDEDETLFYNETCEGASPRLWAFNPQKDAQPVLADALPETLFPIVNEPAAIDYVRADVYPPSAEESVRRLSFPEPWIISPSGRWVAALARHVYGPEDIIIVSTE